MAKMKANIPNLTPAPIVPRRPLPAPATQDSIAAPTVPGTLPSSSAQKLAPPTPDPPMYTSHPSDDSTLHSPRAAKNIPILNRSSPELEHSMATATSNYPNPGRAAYTSCVASSYITNKSLLAFPAAYLSGTKDKCVRHGRKRGEQRATQDQVAKGRTGAYHPTGLFNPRQMEATSPWVVPPDVEFNFHLGMTNVQGRSARGYGEDSCCPDCRAELGIRRREGMWGVMHPVSEEDWLDEGAEQAVTPAVARDFTVKQDVQRSRDPGIFPGPVNDGQAGLVSCEDINDALYAVIFERNGELERVVMNKRYGQANPDILKRLAKELLAVAQDISNYADRAPATKSPASNQLKDPRRTLVLANRSTSKHDGNGCSVSDLMHLVDQAVHSLHNAIHDDKTPSKEQRLVHAQSFHDVKSLHLAAKDHSHEEQKQAENPLPHVSKLSSLMSVIPTIHTRHPNRGASHDHTMPSKHSAPSVSESTSSSSSFNTDTHRPVDSTLQPAGPAAISIVLNSLKSKKAMQNFDSPALKQAFHGIERLEPSLTAAEQASLPIAHNPTPYNRAAHEPSAALKTLKPPSSVQVIQELEPTVLKQTLQDLERLEPSLSAAEQALLPIARNPAPYRHAPHVPSVALMVQTRRMMQAAGTTSAADVTVAKVLARAGQKQEGRGFGWLGVWGGGRSRSASEV
ncbi:hypothetical protein LTR62_007532 [Meristemomyces frigidus]|uniref:Uncharacterized protein n=1 Tax=Meristemomyces frigidus TaxID=1508187 RepID=A0AAN7TAU0_9PEZI|nr:hypothetical protein LTR62_007532 [Meristemomyces frigidus]